MARRSFVVAQAMLHMLDIIQREYRSRVCYKKNEALRPCLLAPFRNKLITVTTKVTVRRTSLVTVTAARLKSTLSSIFRSSDNVSRKIPGRDRIKKSAT